ncbi:MAG: NAD+ synthase [Candidatus Coatesbacteria bacterium]|nr:MAG: NAD+ synthase [Candidatus Coatesbacteria bacterium]
MDKCPEELRIDAELVKPVLERFLRRRVEAAGLQGVVLGISGGVDSAAAAGLAAAALGAENVTGLWLPYHDASDRDDASAVAERFGVKLKEVPVAPMVDAYLAEAGKVDEVRRGNVCARARMIVLFDQSKAANALVLGTGNKTELLLGYFTLFGDGACSLAPLADLYKGQVYQLAEALGVPDQIIQKTPSAGLWPGQTDEGEMGISYLQVDRYLYYLVEQGESPTKLLERGFDADFQRHVITMINRNLFKRHVPVIAAVTGKTITKPIILPQNF